MQQQKHQPQGVEQHHGIHRTLTLSVLAAATIIHSSDVEASITIRTRVHSASAAAMGTGTATAVSVYVLQYSNVISVI